MSTVTTLLTVDEFLDLPEPEGQKIELIAGEVVTMASGGFVHEAVKANVIDMLAVWLHGKGLGKVFSETAYRLDEYNAPIPDVSYMAAERIPRGSTGLIRQAPDIAIEVVSSESAGRLERKIKLYLEHGSRSVWVVYPEERAMRIVDAQGLSRRLESNQQIEDPVLPGFSAPVAGLFVDL